MRVSWHAKSTINNCSVLEEETWIAMQNLTVLSLTLILMNIEIERNMTTYHTTNWRHNEISMYNYSFSARTIKRQISRTFMSFQETIKPATFLFYKKFLRFHSTPKHYKMKILFIYQLFYLKHIIIQTII